MLLVSGIRFGYANNSPVVCACVQVLFEYIDGEDDSSSGNNIAAAAAGETAEGAGSEPREAVDGTAAAAEDGGCADERPGGEGLAGLGLSRRFQGLAAAGESRVQLAGFQRRAALSRWLQRKLKPAVTAAVEALQNPSSSSSSGGGQQQQQQQEVLLWSLLHLLVGRQVSSAVAVAVAVGDVRLASLLAAVGQAAAAAGGGNIAQQLQVSGAIFSL